MKTILFWAILILPVWAEDWSVDGKDYHNVKVSQVEADRVHITYDGGIGTVLLADLTPELKKQFGYDPKKAKAAITEREDAIKPDWEKLTDKFLVDFIPDVEKETASASTEMERLRAESDQNILIVFHNIYSDKKLKDSDIAVLRHWISCLMKEQICVGMPRDFVMMAWGDPDSDTTTTNGDGDDWESMSFGHWSSEVFISGGVVKSISQTSTAQN